MPKKPERKAARVSGATLIRVLFLSASVGVGHVSAANAVCFALRELDPDIHTQVVDSYKYAALVVSRVVSDGYLRMVKTIPQMYRYIYDRAERATEVGPFRTWAHQFTAGNLRSLIERERPDAIVCTHAFPSGAMAEYKRLYDDAPPVIGIVTDFAVHAFWIHDNIEGYCVATQGMRDLMIARGVRPERIAVTGIPGRSALQTQRAAGARDPRAFGFTTRPADCTGDGRRPRNRTIRTRAARNGGGERTARRRRYRRSQCTC